MRTLKFNHQLAAQILDGTKSSTWHVHDDKDILPGDELEVIDKVAADDESTWLRIGTAMIAEVKLKRMGDLNDDDFKDHQRYENDKAMYNAFHQFYGEDVGPETAIKMIRFTFSPYDQPLPYTAVINGTIQHSEVKIFTDGGSRGNPGPSASGYVVLDSNDNVIEEGGEYLGITTNNQAEYRAVRLALEACKKYGAQKVDAYMDSLLVVNQMKGIFKIRNRDLWPIYDEIKQLCKTFEQGVEFTHVPREFNKKADAEVNKILDQHSGN